MSSSFNKVIIMGNLTRDPEIRYTQSNMAVCKVGIALNRRVKDQQSERWKEETTFVDVTLFGKRAEAFEKHHQKGASAFFEGRLAFDQWEDKATGQKRSKLYVVADNWEFVDGAEPREEPARRQPQPQQQSMYGAPAGQSDYGDAYGGGPVDDDTPF